MRGDINRLANPPLFVKEWVEYTPYSEPRQQGKFEAYLIRRGQIPRFVTMPVFARIHRCPTDHASTAVYG